MDYKSLLNERQYQAVTTKSQYVRIVAGAGSGKTRVLTYRISYLISECGVKPYNVLAIAFTNKVAGEMKERALSLLKDNGDGLRVLTFHSFCARFLRIEIGVLNFPSNYIILDEADQKSLLKSIAKSYFVGRNDDVVKKTMSYIAKQKLKGLYPDEIKESKSVSSEQDKILLKMYFQYEMRKNAMHALDFDDLQLRTIQILRKFPEIRDRWRNKFRHILIDEFQDTNDVQYELVKLLMKKETSLYVVGDPDQTIYTWRGANQKIILNFERDFKNAETIILNRNYRSTKCILDASNSLIANNKERVKKDLYTKQEEGELIKAVNCSSRQVEASYVADEIEKLKQNNEHFSYRDVAILYRANYLTLPFEKEFMARKIPYKIYGGVKFFERKEVKDVLAYFRLVYNPDDDVSFERIINVPRRGIGETSLSYLKEESQNANLSIISYLKNIKNYQSQLAGKHIIALTFLIAKIDNVRKEIEERTPKYPAILKDFVQNLGFFEQQNYGDEEVDRIGNIKTLLDDVENFASNHPDEDFKDYLENAALQSAQDELNNGNYVSLMTVHVAKGLEFPYVFVISLNEGVFPSERTILENGERGLEEERRLCYVAFTRAQKVLYLSANRSYNYITNSQNCFSRFFAEAGLVPKMHESDNFYFDDYKYNDFNSDKIDYFDDDKEDENIFESKTNDVSDWKIGDKVKHQTFGEGKVMDVTIDDAGSEILTINFKNHGLKLMSGSHYMLSRDKEGEEA